MNVIVVGSDGYVGRPLCLQLEKRGHTVFRFDIGVYRQKRHPATYAVNRYSVIYSLMRGLSADVIVDLAAYAHDPKGKIPRATILLNNANGPVLLARTAASLGIRYLVPSSLAIHAEGAYPEAKRLLEKELRDLGPMVDIVRFGTLFGIYDETDPAEAITFRQHLLLNSMVVDAIRDRRIFVRGVGRSRPVLSLYAAVNTLVHLIESKGPYGTIQNLFHTCGKIEDFAHLVRDEVGGCVSISYSDVAPDTRDYGWGTLDRTPILGELNQLIEWVKKFGNKLPPKEAQFDALYKFVGVNK